MSRIGSMNRGNLHDSGGNSMPELERTAIPSSALECRVVLLSANGQFARSFVRVVLAKDFAGALQCFANTAAYIFRTNVAFELGLLHQLRGLLACSAEKQGASRIVKSVCQITNGAQAGGINRGHVAQTKDDDGGQFVDGLENAREFVGRAKKERAVNAVNDRVLWDILSLQDMHAAVFYVILGDWANGGGSRDFTNESERCQHHSDFHGKREIGHDGQRQCKQPHRDVR